MDKCSLTCIKCILKISHSNCLQFWSYSTVKFVIFLKSSLFFWRFLMHFLLVNKTYSQITKETYCFKIQIFKVLFSEVREPTNIFLCLYDLTWDTKTTLQVSLGFSFSGLLTWTYIGQNYGGEKYCRISSNSGLK